MNAIKKQPQPRSWQREPLANGKRVSHGDPVYAEIFGFLTDEAMLLDDDRYVEWLDLMADDLQYRMPNRKTVYRRDGDGFDPRNSHFDDTLVTLAHRVKRMDVPTAWERDPLPRQRRFVTNIMVHETETSGEYAVTSYILHLRNRFDDTQFDMLSAKREDIIRRTPGGLKLARRYILVDMGTLGSPYVTAFL